MPAYVLFTRILLLIIILSTADESVEVLERIKFSGGLHLTSGFSHMVRLGFGTAGGALGGRTEELVCHAMKKGFRLFDTAQAQEWYDEVGLGFAVNECWYKKGKDVKDLMIVTKVHPRSYSPHRMQDALEQSRINIYGAVVDDEAPLPSLDVVLLHAPYCWEGHCSEEEKSHSWQGAWKFLEQAKRDGIVSAIGVRSLQNILYNLTATSLTHQSISSNFDSSLLMELTELVNNQSYFLLLSLMLFQF